MNNNLENKTRNLIISHWLFVSGRIFFELFLSLFIYKQTGSLSLVAWFNIVYFSVHTISFHAFGILAKRNLSHILRKLSLVGFISTFIIIAILQDNILNFIMSIAIANGVFNGMYWIGYHVLKFDLTSQGNRGNYSGIEGGLKRISGIVIPAIAGVIIAANWYNLGYANIFIFGAILFFTALLFAGTKANYVGDTDFHLIKTLKVMFANKNIRTMMVTHALSEFGKGGTIVRLVLPLLVFDIMKSELQLGGLLSFFAFVAVLASFTFGKFVKYSKYKTVVTFGGILYVSLLVLILVHPSLFVYILFGALINVADIFLTIPKRVISENLIHTLPNYDNLRIEYMVIREWFNIGFGRLLSFVVLLTVGVLTVINMKLLLILVICAITLEVVLLRSIKL